MKKKTKQPWKIGNTNAVKADSQKVARKMISMHPNTAAWIRLLSAEGNIPSSTIIAEAIKFYALNVLDSDVAARECARQEVEALTANKAHLLRHGMSEAEHAEALADALSRQKNKQKPGRSAL